MPKKQDLNAWDARMRAELGGDVKRQLAELDAIYHAAPVGLCLVDTELRYVHINQQLAAINGQPPEAHIGKMVAELIPELTDSVEPLYRRVLESGEPLFDLEITGTTLAAPNDERVWLMHLAPVKLRDGKVVGVNTVVTDITAMKRVQHELRVFQHIVSATADHMSFVDADYTYRAVSDAYLAAYNRQRDEIVGRTVAELLGEDTFEKIVKPKLDDCLGGKESAYQEWFDFAGKGRRFMDVRYNPFVEKDGTISGVIVTARDFTERKQAEETQRKLGHQLHQARKLKAIGQLAAGVAHDVNSLLMVVLGNTEIAQVALKGSKKDDAAKAMEALGRVGAAVDRGKSLVQKLLAFGRAGASNPVAADLNQIIRDTHDMMRGLVGQEIRFDLRLATGLRRCVVDSAQIVQLVMNLLLNARDAMPEGGDVTIETANVTLDEEFVASRGGSTTAPHVMLAVRDLGVGMDDETVKRMFEPFFTTKPVDKGSGLGLSIVYGVVEQSGGHIDVESKPGEGTLIRAFFPAVEEHEPGDATSGEI